MGNFKNGHNLVRKIFRIYPLPDLVPGWPRGAKSGETQRTAFLPTLAMVQARGATLTSLCSLPMVSKQASLLRVFKPFRWVFDTFKTSRLM